MAISLGPFKRRAATFQPGEFIITGFDAVLSIPSFDETWEYADNGGPSLEDCYRTNAIAYSTSIYTCIELASGDILDFESGTWSGPFGGLYQLQRGDIIYTIKDQTTTAIYYLTRNGQNNITRANLCSDIGLSDCDDQGCRKIACPP